MAVLTCNNLTKYFDHALALDHVNLEIQPGRIVGLLGPNGSGKTTLIKLANGLLTPSSGELRIDGQLPSPATRELVSYLPERPYLADWMTVSQLLASSATFTRTSTAARRRRCSWRCRSVRSCASSR